MVQAPLNRLTKADYSTGESFAYQYDAVGNRTVMTDATGVTTYTYDAANRLTNLGDVSYTWDARGNLVSDGTFTLHTHTTPPDGWCGRRAPPSRWCTPALVVCARCMQRPGITRGAIREILPIRCRRRDRVCVGLGLQTAGTGYAGM